jgi:hypothetical protein
MRFDTVHVTLLVPISVREPGNKAYLSELLGNIAPVIAEAISRIKPIIENFFIMKNNFHHCIIASVVY